MIANWNRIPTTLNSMTESNLKYLWFVIKLINVCLLLIIKMHDHYLYILLLEKIPFQNGEKLSKRNSQQIREKTKLSANFLSKTDHFISIFKVMSRPYQTYRQKHLKRCDYLKQNISCFSVLNVQILHMRFRSGSV